ncbi:competence protein CoiA [Streptococcus danieliae]|uniref:Competence protein CoiA n=1 Tax=Streptococcus danieliae TaxID=747656 RepID=A0A7X3KD34_9STRE|nr:competence protein CoiA family protein [Streptococcus danieliae]MVX59213.1 competence protein CoiA [Streptococcus danieliae]
MFQAIDAKGQLHHLLTGPLPQGGVFFCPGCKQELVLKSGRQIRPHFAHKVGQACEWATLNEGAEHLNLKAALFDWGQIHEATALEVGQAEGAVVSDLLLSQNLALEIQCSPLSPQDYGRRSQVYQDLDLPVVWLLGSKHFFKGRLTELQRLCLQFSPSCGYFFWNLDGEKQELVLHYLLHQDLHGRCQGLVAVFPFFQKPLREVLRWPYQQRQLRSFEGRLDWHFPRYLAKQLQYRNSYWVEQQLLAYQAGQNLLTRSLADWYPQLVPVKPVEGFRLQSDLERDYEQQFLAFYAQSSSVYRQVLYSPFYYKRECDKIGTMEEINS